MNSDDGNSSPPTSRRWQFSLRSMFWLTTVAGFYAWLFIRELKSFFGMGIMGIMAIVFVVWLYAMLTVVTVLMFWTRGKAIIGVAAGFILVSLVIYLLVGQRHFG